MAIFWNYIGQLPIVKYSLWIPLPPFKNRILSRKFADYNELLMWLLLCLLLFGTLSLLLLSFLLLFSLLILLLLLFVQKLTLKFSQNQVSNSWDTVHVIFCLFLLLFCWYQAIKVDQNQVSNSWGCSWHWCCCFYCHNPNSTPT